MEKQLLLDNAAEAEKVIFSFLPAEDVNDERIISAMDYSVKAGGKRLRPIMMRESYRMFAGGEPESRLLHTFMAAMEFIHSASLCHDDLPAMDNDRLRRGKPSTWAAYDEAFGVLAGDALINWAYEIIAAELDNTDDAVQLKRGTSAFNVFAAKAGIHGMIGGQCLDVYSEKTDGYQLNLDQIMYIHKNKTAALIESSLMCGAILAGADADQVKTMEKIAENVGFAFQIRDDILDVISTTEELGKPVGSDEKNNKVTYVTIKGIEDAQGDVQKFSENAVHLMDSLPVKNEFLRELILQMVGRKK